MTDEKYIELDDAYSFAHDNEYVLEVFRLAPLVRKERDRRRNLWLEKNKNKRYGSVI